MHHLLRYAIDKQRDIVALIREFVECESPSGSPSSIDRFCDLIIERTRDIAEAKKYPSSAAGPSLRLEFQLPGSKQPSQSQSGQLQSSQILGLGHVDTVWPLGTLPKMPFREADGRLWGPGVYDMKAGLVFFIFAARALRDLDIEVNAKVVLLAVSDEEVGSASSRELTESEAKLSRAVLVLEPGTGLTGKLKTARKGVGDYTLRVKGRASHAGVDFSSGANAILEVSRQIGIIAGFTDLNRGITVNPGVIRGGTRTNVIAAEAEVEIDIRIAEAAQADELDHRFRTLKPFDMRCELIVEGGLNRPPMERTPQIVELFQKARSLGAELGIDLEESSTGGGSDGNFTAGLGIPTLDGLGAVGEGAHAINESILVDRIADRTALLAGLLQSL